MTTMAEEETEESNGYKVTLPAFQGPLDLLLTLARSRLSDQVDASLPSTSHGWIEQSRLVRMLATTLAQLTLDIYRARRQFADAGVVDSAQVVERRASSRELRVGVEQLQIRAQ